MLLPYSSIKYAYAQYLCSNEKPRYFVYMGQVPRYCGSNPISHKMDIEMRILHGPGQNSQTVITKIPTNNQNIQVHVNVDWLLTSFWWVKCSRWVGQLLVDWLIWRGWVQEVTNYEIKQIKNHYKKHIKYHYSSIWWTLCKTHKNYSKDKTPNID